PDAEAPAGEQKAGTTGAPPTHGPPTTATKSRARARTTSGGARPPARQSHGSTCARAPTSSGQLVKSTTTATSAPIMTCASGSCTCAHVQAVCTSAVLATAATLSHGQGPRVAE